MAYPEPTKVLVRQDGKWSRVVRLDYALPEQPNVAAQASGVAAELEEDFDIPF